MSGREKDIARIEAGLIEAEKKSNRLNIIYNSILFLAGAAAILFLFSLAEAVFFMEREVRIFTALILLVSVSALLYYLIIYRLVIKRIKHSREEHIRMAGYAGRFYPEIKDNLKNLLQIAYEPGPGASEEIVNAAVKKGADDYNGYDYTKIVSFKKRSLPAGAAFFIFSIAALCFIFSPSIRFAAYRLISFDKNFTQPAKYNFTIKPGDGIAARGDKLKIDITVKELYSGSLNIFIKQAEEAGYTSKTIHSSAPGKFEYVIDALNSSFRYYVSLEGIKSREYEITLVNRPVIQQMAIKIIPPSYTKLSAETIKDNGTAGAVKGTRIEFTIKSTRPLRESFIKAGDSVIANMRVNGNSASGSLNLMRDLSYYFELVDREGNKSINPVNYTLQCIQDEYPSIAIIVPEKEIKLSEGKKIGIKAGIKDDFGFARAEIKYRISESEIRKPEENYTAVRLPVRSETAEQEINYLWDTEKLNLNEGETVSWLIEIFDNDIISGPKKTASEIYFVKIPSLNETARSIYNKEEEIEKELNELLKDAERTREELRKAANDLKKDKKELSWEEKNNISRTLENAEKLRDNIEKAKEKLDEIKKEVNNSGLFSRETVEKYKELQKLFEELNSGEFIQALKKMQESLGAMMRDNVLNAVKQLGDEEEVLRAGIERTMNLLKRIKVEMKIDELIKRSSALKEKADDIEKRIKSWDLNNAQTKEELLNRQEDLTGGIKSLNDELRYAEHLMTGLDNMPLEEIKKIRNETSAQKNENISEEARASINNGNREKAAGGNRAVSKNLSSLNNMLSGMKKSFQQMNQMKTLAEMMKALNNLITLSKEQEKLLKETETEYFSPDRLKGKAVPQNGIRNNLLNVIRSISALSQKTLGITPETGQALGSAYSAMMEAVSLLQGGAGSPHKYMKTAMEGLNKGAVMLKGSIDRMAGGGTGGGMASLMQQLEQAAQQQMKLNEITRQLGSGGLTPQEQAEMQRLASTQELIRKSLEKINREAMEAGRSKTFGGSLEKTIEEMRSIAEEMERNPAGKEIINRQEKILTRMLDSQRSLTEKDFEKERESKSGGEFNLTQPAQRTPGKEKESRYADELRKALREEYKKDYEMLIKRYLELLEKKEKK